MSDRLFDPTAVYADEATAPHTPGQRMVDHRGFEYMFVEAANSLTLHHTAVMRSNYTARLITDDTARPIDRVGVVLFTAIPQNSFGWVCIWGVGSLNVAASCANRVHLYTTDTGGRLDDGSTSHERILNIVLTTSRGNTSGNAPAVWHYPSMA